MDEGLWMGAVNEGIPLLLLLVLGIILYQGLKKNQVLLIEREELLKRYLLFRGDKQVRLKVYGKDEKVYQELLKNLSNSWKNFKRSYDEYLLSFSQNTAKTKVYLRLITLALLVNTTRLGLEAYYFHGLKEQFLYTVLKELSTYVLVVLSFLLLRTQTHRFLSLKGEITKMERELLFFPNHLSAEGEHEVLYNEFDPLETKAQEDGKENTNPPA
jgi:hypothetical protein